MILSILLAGFAVLPNISAQSIAASGAVTSVATRCTTRYGYSSLVPSGTESTVSVPTWYTSLTSYNIAKLSTVVYDSTVTATPNATIVNNISTLTLTVEVTTTSTPSAVTIPAPSGFFPLIAVQVAQATGSISRVKRTRTELLHSRALSLFKRQTPVGNTGGFEVDEDGETTDLNREYQQRVDCWVTLTINSTVVESIPGPATTVLLGPATLTRAVSTETVSKTVTVTQVAPTPSPYAACQPNNVVNSIIDFNGNRLVFNRILYRPAEGFPIATELIVNTTSGVNCCIACQNTANCAGSFYVPSKGNCHIRLTERTSAGAIGNNNNNNNNNGSSSSSSNSSSGSVTLGLPAPSLIPYPLLNSTNSSILVPTAGASGVLWHTEVPVVPGLNASSSSSFFPFATPDSVSSFPALSTTSFLPIPLVNFTTAIPIGVTNGTSPSTNPFTYPQNSNATCATGSMSLYIGMIQGTESFDITKAISFSNGPCGRMSVWPLPVRPGVEMQMSDPVPGRENPFDRL